MKVTVVSVLVLALGLVSAGQDDSLLQFLNYGVLLTRLGTLDNSGQLLAMPFDLNIPDLHEIFVDFNCSQHEDVDLCQRFPQLPDLFNLAKQSIHQEWEALTEELNHILPEMPAKYRLQLRSGDGLIPFGGLVGKFLVGTGSTLENDKLLDVVADFKKKVGNVSDAMAANTKFLQGLEKTSQKKFEALKDEVQELYRQMAVRYGALKRAEENSFQLGVESALFVAVQSQALWMGRMLLKDYRDAVQTLSKHRLSSFFVEPKRLEEALRELDYDLKRHHGQYELKEHSPQYYYHANAAHAFLHRDDQGTRKIIVFLNAPITSNKPRYYKVYRVTSVPCPFGKGLGHATLVTNLPKYFAVSEDQTHYMEMDKWQPSLCRDDICPGLRQETTTSVPSCMLGIYSNNVQMVREHCQFKFFPEGLRHFMLEVQPSQVLLSKATGPMLSCDGKESEYLPPCDLCLVTVPCRCRLQSGNSFITERVTRCNKNGDYSVLHPINMALVLTLENQTLLDSFTGNKQLAKDMILGLPEPRLSEAGLDKYREVDQHLGLALDGAMQKIVKDNEIFQNDVQVFQSVNFSELNEDFVVWKYVMPSLVACLAVVAFGAGLVLCCKMRPYVDKLHKLKRQSEKQEQQKMIPMKEHQAADQVHLPEVKVRMLVQSEQL